MIAQVTSVCGVDVKYAPSEWHGKQYQARMEAPCERPGDFADVRVLGSDEHDLEGKVRDD